MYEEFLGFSFVLGILGIGVTFIITYIRGNSEFCKRITCIETKIVQIYDMIESLRHDRDKFHPRHD